MSKRAFRQRSTILLFLLVLPSLAFAFDCNETGTFRITALRNYKKDLDPGTCVMCYGPERRSVPLIVSKLAYGQRCSWYAAEDNALWSASGEWTCVVGHTDIFGGCPDQDGASETKFCQYPTDLFDILLTLNVGYNNLGVLALQLSSDIDNGHIPLPRPPCPDFGIRSVLGDNPDESGMARDSDHFAINVTAGGRLTIQLLPDGKAGSNLGQATLVFSGRSVRKRISGALPIQTVIMLPSAGQYSVTITQSGTNPFRGTFQLLFHSESGGISQVASDEPISH